MGIELEAGEVEHGKWTVNFLTGDGDRFTGDLVVTDRRLLFGARYESGHLVRKIASTIGLAAIDTTVAASYGVAISDSGDFSIVVPRDKIRDVISRRKGLTKQVVVTTVDDAELVFDYGVLSTKKIVAALG